jgi:mycoredoxin
MSTWLSAIAISAIGVFSGVRGVADGDVVGIVAAPALLLVAVFNSPLRPGRHVSLSEARRRPGPDDVIVFWRPGCSVCIIERARLARAERRSVTW